MTDFPSNSKTTPTPKKAASKKAKPEVVESVVVGPTKVKKKGLGDRFKQVFLGADLRGAADYILMDVVVPAVRNLVVDSATKGIERVIYGETTRRPTRSGARQPSQTIYGTPVPRQGRTNMLPDQPPRYVSGRPGPSAQGDIIYASMEEANMVLDNLRTITEQYGYSSVSDYKGLSGVATTYVDQGYGWYNLANVGVRQIRDGFLIDLPNPDPIHNH